MGQLPPPRRPSHPEDGLTLSGSIQIRPPLGSDEIDLLHTIALLTLRSAIDEQPSALVDRLAPEHPDGPSGWVPCPDGCCLELDDRGFARIDAIEPWLRYLVSSLLSSHDVQGSLMMYDHADRTFSALTVAGSQVRRQRVLGRDAGSRRRTKRADGLRLVSGA